MQSGLLHRVGETIGISTSHYSVDLFTAKTGQTVIEQPCNKVIQQVLYINHTALCIAVP